MFLSSIMIQGVCHSTGCVCLLLLGSSPRASLMQEPPLCVSSVFCLDTSHSCVGALEVKLHVFPMKTGLWCSQLCLGSVHSFSCWWQRSGMVHAFSLGKTNVFSKVVLIKKWQVTYYLIQTEQQAKQNLLLLLTWRGSVGNWISTGNQSCKKLLSHEEILIRGGFMEDTSFVWFP